MASERPRQSWVAFAFLLNAGLVAGHFAVFAFTGSRLVLAQGADLVIVNKFGKQECYGQGFRHFIAEALARGIPVLLSVPAGQLPDFQDFAGDLAEPVAPAAILDWCRARRIAA